MATTRPLHFVSIMFDNPADAQAYIDGMGYKVNSENAAYRIDQLCMDSHARSASCGWWTDLDAYAKDGSIVPKEMNVGERYVLMHTELSEAYEAVRTDAKSKKIPGFTEEEEELADLLHRVFDYASARGLRLGDAYTAKGIYNLSREDHKLENRIKPGGKKS